MVTASTDGYHYILQKMSHIIIFLWQQIYKSAKENLENLKEFFYEDENDPILINYKLKDYINKIQENNFLQGLLIFI